MTHGQLIRQRLAFGMRTISACICMLGLVACSSLPGESSPVSAADTDRLWISASDGTTERLQAISESTESSESSETAETSDSNREGPVVEASEDVEQPRATTEDAVDLLDVLSHAQEYDADFQAALTDRSIAMRAEPIARSALLPQINAAYAGGLYDFEGDSSEEYSGHQLTLTLSQALYDRANAIAVDQARLAGSIADTTFQAQHEDLVIRVTTAYFDVLKARATLGYRQSDVEATELQLQQTRSRYEVGYISETDVAEAQAQYDLAVADEITAQAQLDAAMEALQVSTGMTLNSDVAQLDPEMPFESPDPADVEAWVQTALAHNKSLQVARSQIETAQQQVRQTRASRSPVVSLTGYLSAIDSDYDYSDDVSAGGYQGKSLELGVSLPIYTGGLISAQVAQEQDRVRLAGDQLQSVERQVIQTTRDTYRGVLSAISRVTALSQAMESTRQATSATRAGFREGIRTSVDVLDSQRDTLRAQTDLTAARYDYVLQLLQLKRVSDTLELADVARLNNWLQ